jgi:hypothetical protein
VHNVHDSNISNNSLREEERLQQSPTPQSFQLSQLKQVDEGELIDQTWGQSWKSFKKNPIFDEVQEEFAILPRLEEGL